VLQAEAEVLQVQLGGVHSDGEHAGLAWSPQQVQEAVY
jgi:hypothetical protein